MKVKGQTENLYTEIGTAQTKLGRNLLKQAQKEGIYGNTVNPYVNMRNANLPSSNPYVTMSPIKQNTEGEYVELA